MTVVGVVGDIRHLGPATPPRPEFYQPHSQNSFPFMAFVVRAAASPESLVPSIRAAIRSLDPAQPISGVNTMEQHVARSLSRPKVLSSLVATFGALALILAGSVSTASWRTPSHSERGKSPFASHSAPPRAKSCQHGADASRLALGCGRRRWPLAASLALSRRAAGTALRRYGCRSGNLRRRYGTAHCGRGTGCGRSRMAGDENPGGERPPIGARGIWERSGEYRGNRILKRSNGANGVNGGAAR